MTLTKIDPPVAPAPLDTISPAVDATSFTAHNGVTYTRTEGLSVARMRVFQRYSLELALNTSINGFIASIDSVWENLNKMQLGNAIHSVGHIRDGINTLIGSNRLRDVEITALFFNSPTEDPNTYVHVDQQRKCYEDWAGVHSGFFFRQALSLLSTSLGAYGPTPEEVEQLPTPPEPDAQP